MKQMTIFDLDKSNRYHGKPDYGNNKDEIVRLCIEDKFERAITLYKCCNVEPKGMFRSCKEYFVRCPICNTRTRYFRHLYEAKQAWNRGERYNQMKGGTK